MLFQSISQTFVLLLLSLPVSRGLHFYLNADQVKCFYENLSLGDLLIGDIDGYVQKEGEFVQDPQLALKVTIDELFDSSHRAMKQDNVDIGGFTYTPLSAGEHRVCVTPVYPQKEATLGIFLELGITSIQVLDTRGKNNRGMLNQRVLRMIRRLERIAVEQKLIKEKEAQFRNQSEATHSKILWWSFIQVAGLAVMCILQLRHLRNFFIKQKSI